MGFAVKCWRSMIRGLIAFLLLVCSGAVAPSGAQSTASSVQVVLTSGHSHWVNAVAYSPDGRTIVSGSNTLKLWDAASGRELRELVGHSKEVGTVAFSPDGQTIVSGSGDNTLKLWDAASGRELRTLAGHANSVTTVAFSPDGRAIVSGSLDGMLKLWDASSGRELRTLAARSAVHAVAFSPDGRTLVSGNSDYTLKLWDTASGRELRTLTGHSAYVVAVAFSPDGRTIVSGSWDSTLKLWDAANGQELHTLKGGADEVAAVAFSPDGRSIASGSYGLGDNLKLWNSTTGQEVRTLKGKGFSGKAVAFSPDGRTIVYGGTAGTLKLFDAGSGQELRTLAGHSREVNKVAFSPDGRTIVFGIIDDTFKLWDTASGRELRRLEGHSVAISPDSRTMVSGGDDNTVKFWDAASGEELRTLKGHTDSVKAIAFSPDGRTVVTGGVDKTLKLWDAASGRELRTLKGHTDLVKAVSFSPDGRSIVSGSEDSTLKLWDAASGRSLRTLKGHIDSVNAVAFSADGRRIVSGSGYDILLPDRGSDTIRLWDAASGRELRTLAGHSLRVTSVAFSPDGRTIVSGSDDRTLKIWDTASGRELRTLAGHSGSVNAVAFSPDGRTIASASKDGSIRLWTAGGDTLATLVAGTVGESLTLTPEGFFDASSPKAAEAISIVRGLEAYSIDQLYNQLYRPDLVREKLAGDPHGKVREAAAKLDLSKAVASGSAPRVAITVPATGTSIPGEQTMVDAEVIDQGGGIGKVEWRVNGVTLGVEERGIKRIVDGTSPNQSGQVRTIKVSRTLGLAPGENRIAVLAYNEAGLIASEPVEIVVTSLQEKTAAAPRLYVLAVGVNDYWDSALHLSFASPDAKAFSDGLKQAGGKLYERVEVKTVLDDEATAEKLDGVFTELGKKVRPQDVFVFFLAGHGKTVDARFYFLPQDFHYAGEDFDHQEGGRPGPAAGVVLADQGAEKRAAVRRLRERFADRRPHRDARDRGEDGD